jgi:hypothetical protein
MLDVDVTTMLAIATNLLVALVNVLVVVLATDLVVLTALSTDATDVTTDAVKTLNLPKYNTAVDVLAAVKAFLTALEIELAVVMA